MADLPCSIEDRNFQSHIENPKDGGVDKRVQDVCANQTLEAILAALGGASNTTPTIFNITIAAADTEQSQALPANTKRLLIKTRGNTLLKLAYNATESGTKYVTIPKQGVFTDNSFYTSQTIYFQSPQAGDVVEIIAYA